MAQRHKPVTVNATVNPQGSIHTQGNEIFDIFISPLLRFASQYEIAPVFGGKCVNGSVSIETECYF